MSKCRSEIEGIGTVIDKQSIIRRRGGKCERCGSKKYLQLHHALVGKKSHEEYNLEVLCQSCHLGRGHGIEQRRAFWARQCERYGRDVMESWISSLGLKTREWWD